MLLFASHADFAKTLSGKVSLINYFVFHYTNAILCCGSRHCYLGSYLFVHSNMCSYVNMDAGVYIHTHLAGM
jgi:hypothetical protein